MVFFYIGTIRHDLWRFLAHKLLIKIPSIQPRPRPVDAFHVDLLLHWECQLGPATKCGCWANGHGQQMAAVRESLLKAKHSWSSISICISEWMVPIPNIAMGWTCLVTKKDQLWAIGLRGSYQMPNSWSNSLNSKTRACWQRHLDHCIRWSPNPAAGMNLLMKKQTMVAYQTILYLTQDKHL